MHRRWLGSLLVRALDSRLNGCEFDSRPWRCRVTTLGKLFTPMHVPLSPSSINWYRCKSRGVNRHNTRCTSPISVVSQYKLAEGYGNGDQCRPMGSCGSGRTLHLRFLCTESTVHTNILVVTKILNEI